MVLYLIVFTPWGVVPSSSALGSKRSFLSVYPLRFLRAAGTVATLALSGCEFYKYLYPLVVCEAM
jgi:hypothetical protein